MFICHLGMHNNVQGHRNANVCKQKYIILASLTVSKFEVVYEIYFLNANVLARTGSVSIST